ncbi:flagellar hook-associated protein FlgK [Xylophilus sp.]|uniref:flagellar hook-associated protein FlgK n=1 Tax=Xylophilus sp. TaxID=2653893 RepID=UPI0013B86E0D|nr:flagellar hook-associated protein FlgK [Xylophilus sp.]KAF1044619.1 MAG: Flagellar hook-associated protein 1 [Xylophilus sp.]
MSSLLNVAARALMANQAVLNTVGHNIANVNTPGYSRQTTVLSPVAGQFSGGGYIGKGVELVTVQRNYSEFLTKQSALAKSTAALDAARSQRLSQLQDVFPSGTDGLGSAITDMLNAFSDVVSAPTDLTARSVVLTRADELTARLRQASQQLGDLKSGVSQELQNSVTSANSIIGRIAAVNDQIARATGNGQTPNDLLDQRDQLVSQLNQYAQTSTVAASDGTLSVFVGNQAVVLGTTTAQLALKTDDYGELKLMADRDGVETSIDEFHLAGGEIAGNLRFYNKDLTEGANLLGRLALSLATTVNAQHQVGVDFNGNAGGNFFTPITIPDARAASFNTGTATVSATVGDASQLEASNYQILFTSATGGSITRLSDGVAENFTVSGTPPTIQTASGTGLTLTVSGTPNAGDAYVLEPYATAASQMQMAFSSPRELAVANPVEASIASTNTGSLAVTSLQATPALGANATTTGYAATLTFAAGPPATYTVTGSGTPASGTTASYVPGQTISIDGWELKLTGSPQDGDTIQVGKATSDFSQRNAGNASALMNRRDKTLFDGGSLSDGYASLIAQIGVRTQAAQYASSVSDQIAASTESDRTAVSGVNLDEEAARLLQFQQAYQACSKMVQIANGIFDSLIANMGR